MILKVDFIVLVAYTSSMTFYTPAQSSNGEVVSLETSLRIFFGSFLSALVIDGNKTYP